jgi:hypothetical protein
MRHEWLDEPRVPRDVGRVETPGVVASERRPAFDDGDAGARLRFAERRGDERVLKAAAYQHVIPLRHDFD